MRSSNAASNTSPWRTLRRGVAVALLGLVGYVLLLALLTVVRVAGAPLISRAVPVIEAGGGKTFSLLRFREAEHSGPVDIVILGPSAAYGTFDPQWVKTLGYSSLTLGSPAQTPAHTLGLANRYLDRLQPRLAILMISQEILASDGYEGYADIAGNTEMDGNILGMAMANPDLLTANITLATAVDHWFHPVAAARQNEVPYRNYVPGGYVENNTVFKGREFKKPVRIEMLPAHLDAMQQLVRLIAARKIPCVAITAPITPQARARMLNYTDNLRILEQRFAATSTPYKDFSESMALTSMEDFGDELHLSPRGVSKTQSTVFAWIGSLGLMPPAKAP